jgi:glycosyltransferase involved in cell wall biosynthesis
VLVASRFMRDELARHGVSPERLAVVPLWPPRMVSEHAPPPPRSPSGKLIFVGRLTALKGADILLAAMPLAKSQLGIDLTLTVVGDGPLRSTLTDLARRLGITATFAGWLEGDAMASRMRDADLLVVPSTWPEPFGLAGIEAGCVGLPAVAFPVGGITEWLEPGVTGELAGPELTPPSLSGAIVKALRDPLHLDRLRNGAWRSSQTFTADRHVDRLESILRALARDGTVCAPALPVDGGEVGSGVAP